MSEDKKISKNILFLIMLGVFLFAFFVPFANPKVSKAIQEAFLMLSEYAREHVLLCLIPAFFIAGAIIVFLNQQAIIRCLGPNANKFIAYSVASISGTILAVCSCTVLPIFKGIYKKGAGIGPAVSFLYSGPAINILAIVLTAKVLGWQIGTARVIGAVGFAFIIGILMGLIFKKEDEKRLTDERMFQYTRDEGKKLWQNLIYMGSMIAILIFLNWAQSKGSMFIWDLIFKVKYFITAFFGIVLILSLILWFKKEELKEWVIATRDFALQIVPLLFGGILIAGFLLGRPGYKALIPMEWVAKLVGGNSILSNFIAAVSGALMYFATLTEVPILQGLLGANMGNGPALALLLAGPSLSLPSMLVINGELGPKKTIVYLSLVVVLSTIAGFIFGMIYTKPLL